MGTLVRLALTRVLDNTEFVLLPTANAIISFNSTGQIKSVVFPVPVYCNKAGSEYREFTNKMWHINAEQSTGLTIDGFPVFENDTLSAKSDNTYYIVKYSSAYGAYSLYSEGNNQFYDYFTNQHTNHFKYLGRLTPSGDRIHLS